MLLTVSACETAETVRPETPFDGIYTVQEAQPADHYLLTLKKSTDKTGTYSIENLANLVKGPLEAQVSGSHLVIKDQAYTNYLGDKYIITGDGKMAGDILILHYNIKGHNGYEGAVFAKKQVDGN
ncbi:hypothetical protein ACO2Q8_09440 [Larkinella sp. VNQ87]|uniref:hypothetical protein n=1 Tax=Larkinella sp. VNQ87 TaxID=3400921 RepID=UPI003C07CCCF